MTCRIVLAKDRHKFSAAHMTFFPDGTKEPLHGHNYQVGVALSLKQTSFQKMLSLSLVKEQIVELCGRWDERVLLPRRSKMLRIIKREKETKASQLETEFFACKKHYVIPSDEIAWIDADNITIEALCGVFAKELRNALKKNSQIKTLISSIEVSIFETRGQGASLEIPFGL